jgi:hypothetical protein
VIASIKKEIGDFQNYKLALPGIPSRKQLEALL